MNAGSAPQPIERSPLSRHQWGVLGVVAGGFLGLGLMEGSAGALWPDVIDAFDVSKGAFGVASGIGLTAAFPVLILGGRLTTRFDKRLLMAVSGLMMLVASLGLTIGHGLWVLAMLLVVRGVGIVLLDLSANALAMEVEGESGRHLMSPLHAGFSGGAMLGAGIAWVVFSMGGTFRTVYVVLVVMLAAYAAFSLRERIMLPLPKRRTEVAGTSALSLSLFRRKDIRVISVICAVSFSGELLIAQWIGIYLRDEQGHSASIGARAVILLGASMFLGRIVNAPVTNKLGPQRALLVQGVLLALGGGSIVAGDDAVLTIIGCGVAGMGLAGMAPTALSLAGLAIPTNPGAASGASLIGGYLGVALMPFVAGFVATVASVRVMLTVEVIYGIIVALISLRLARWMASDPADSATV